MSPSVSLPVEIFLSGIPATYKTTTALLLGSETGIQVVSTDHLRCVQRMYDPSNLLQGETHTRFAILGGEKLLYQGVEAQSRLVKPAVEAIRKENIARGQSIIIEGVHLLPSLYSTKQQFLLYEADKTRLWERLLRKFSTKPVLAERFNKHKIDQLMIIQEELLKEAFSKNVVVIEVSSPDEMKQQILIRLEL